MADKVFSFYDRDNTRTRVLVKERGALNYIATDYDYEVETETGNYDFNQPVGYGDTELSAIYDLNQKMIDAGLWSSSVEDY